MKKLSAILFSLLFVYGTLFAAGQTQVDVERSHFWGRIAFKGKLMPNGLGVFAMVGSRNNLSAEISKTPDGGTAKAVENLDTMGSWLNEAWVGPAFGTKLAPKFKYYGILAYRPQMWFYGDAQKFTNLDYSLDSVKTNGAKYWGKEHVRHTVDFHNNFVYNLGFMKVKYRLILWNTLPYTDGVTKDATDSTKDYEWSNQLINRNKLEFIIPLHKMFDIVLAEEVFLNLTPDANEGDVTFWKNAIWAGFDIKPIKGLNIGLRYINYITYADGDANADYLPNQKKTVTDHYGMVQVTYAMNLAGNKKAQDMMNKAKESDEYKDAKEKADNAKSDAENKINEEKEGL